ncbi:hypothetical protein BDR04DRAFT_1099939 [Suillus decipiens]|nr:hypothetical protein BDR04DRAFT_1099939 [Suillus decipiens]
MSYSTMEMSRSVYRSDSFSFLYIVRPSRFLRPAHSHWPMEYVLTPSTPGSSTLNSSITSSLNLNFTSGIPIPLSASLCGVRDLRSSMLTLGVVLFCLVAQYCREIKRTHIADGPFRVIDL